MTTTSQQPTTSSLQDTEHLVNNFLTSCRNRSLSDWTIKWYGGVLIPFAVKFKELPAEPELIESYIGSYQSGDERRYGVFRILRAFYNFTCKRQEINNPIEKVYRPRVLPKAKKAMTLPELHQLLSYPAHNDVIKPILHLLADTGMRIGELARIAAADISPGAVKIKGKTGERIVPISDDVYNMLESIRPQSTAKEQRLFPWTPLWLGRLVSRAIKAAGLNGFNCHSLRHTFCTLWDGNDTALKYITGHASWRMIEHYKHNREAQAAGQHRVHSPLAQLNGKQPEPEPLTKTEVMDSDFNTVIKLAEELGITKERLNQHSNGPVTGQVTSEEFLKQFLAGPEELSGWQGMIIARAKFTMHAALHNFAINLLHIVDQLANEGKWLNFNSKDVVGRIMDVFILEQYSEEKIKQEATEDYKKLWATLGNMLRAFIADQQIQALTYRELAEDTTDIEEVQFSL